MGLNWDKLEKIVSGKRERNLAGEEAAYPTNILLQITLPMVLILGFVVFTRIGILENLVKQYGSGSAWTQYNKAYLELQKQILMKKWEKLRSEKRKYLKIDLFLSNSTRMKEVSDRFFSDRSVDDYFKEMCRKTYDCLNSERRRRIEIDSLYTKVLEETRKELRRLEKESNFSYMVLMEEDKRSIKALIKDFIEGLVKDVTALQHKTIDMIFANFLDNPGQLKDSRLNNLLKEYKQATEKDKILFVKRIYDSLFEKLEADLKSQDCFFLEETWRKMKLLNQR